MSDWLVRDTSRDNEKPAESRSEAEERKSDLVSLGANPEDIEIVPPNEAKADGGEPVEPEVIDESEPDTTNAVEPERTVSKTIPDKPTSIDEDPIDWVPGHFIDQIQGVPTINRKGYCVLAERYGVSVKAEPVTLPSETDFEYAEFRAVATTQDGQEYTGFGSAHVDRQDGDDEHLLGELAETRSLKRATAWATGIGMTAIEEMKGELE